MGENIRLSLKGIFSHKMRSFLTMLGIIIGIASIIAIVSTIQGTNRQIEKNLIGAGDNLVKVTLYQDGYTYYMDNDLPNGVPVIEDSTKEQLRSIIAKVSVYSGKEKAITWYIISILPCLAVISVGLNPIICRLQD